MAVIITESDLPSAIQASESIELMVAGANAKASRVAPCLASTDPYPTDDQLAEARLILVGAVKRWVETGAGAAQTQQAGPFAQTIDTRQRTGYNLWPSEIEGLQAVCAGEDTSNTAFSFRPGGSTSSHMTWCALAFGALYCSCGSDLTNYEYPLYEGGILSDGDEY